MPYFSVIMPSKNRADLIGESIQSILDQTFKDWELLVIDDHGDDNTKDIINKINDSRISYFYLDKSYGPGGARDFGIRKAKGDIIVMADSDDVNYPNRLELTHKVFEENQKIDIVYGRSNMIDKNGTITPRPTSEFNPQLLKFYNFISGITAAFKKEGYIETNGYDPNIRTCEDYDLWLTFSEKGYNFSFIDHFLVLQKIHPQSILLKTNIEKRKNNLAYVREKHRLPRPHYKDVKKIVQNKDLLDFISTPGAIDYWFKKTNL